MKYGIPKIPDVFYNLYSATIVFLIIKISVILKVARDDILQSKSENSQSENIIKTIMNLSIYGLSIITFMLIMAI